MAEQDLKKRQYNDMMKRPELNKDREVVRTKFVMGLVYLYRYLNSVELIVEADRSILKGAIYEVMEEAKLTKKELELFEFEISNRGI